MKFWILTENFYTQETSKFLPVLTGSQSFLSGEGDMDTFPSIEDKLLFKESGHRLRKQG